MPYSDPTESIYRIVGEYIPVYSGVISNLYRVKNIKQTGSVFYDRQANILTKTVGNFINSYEIFNTVGRLENNLSIRDMPISCTMNPILVLTSTAIYTMPSRNRNKSVFALKFSAPGDKNSLRNGGTDLESGEYSPYNSMNWRNITTRKNLDIDFRTVFSLNSTSTYTTHKTNPNTRYKTRLATSYETKSDNGFIQFQLPFHNDQQTWISSSLKKAFNPWVTASFPLHFTEFNEQTGSEYYYTNSLTALDSGQVNSAITGPKNGSNLTSSWSTEVGSVYGFNTWTQRRMSQNWKSRLLKNNCYIVIDKDIDSDNIFTITSSR